ncbi:MAG: hypothetical protein CME58_11005 [Halieaceae bacterium]|nr:hypothetical protein [Halieaceae bacterium]
MRPPNSGLTKRRCSLTDALRLAPLFIQAYIAAVTRLEGHSNDQPCCAVTMTRSSMIFGGAVAGLVVASMMFIGEHDDGAFSAFSQKDVLQEIPQAPCPVKEASKEEIRRLATIELPTLPAPEPETTAESCALTETG